MQELVNVDIDDVYPYEDAEGNSLNPRDFTTAASAEYVAQLAEQFRYNRLNPGQPRVKPILYRDGGIYWIIDGECRWRAMRSIGTKRFLAEVYDDLADAETARAEAAKAMVETDCKLNLTAEEMSRGVQQMLALDLPDDEVAAVARIEPEKVRRARRAAAKVEDAAYDMTLDRLMAIAEFDGTAEGDEEAVAELRDCPQPQWRSVHRRRSAARERALTLAALEAELARAGVPRVPEGDGAARRCAGSIWLDGRAPKRLAEALAEAAEPFDAYDVDGGWLELLRAWTEEDRGREEAELAAKAEQERERQRVMETWEVERGARLAWLGSHLGNLRSMGSTAAVLADAAMERVEGLLSRLGCEVDMSPTAALCAIGWARTWSPDGATALALARGRVNGWQVNDDRAARFVELMDAMAADGAATGEVTAAVLGTLRGHLEGIDG